MNWQSEVVEKLKKHNQILFSKDCAFLQDLVLLLREQSHPVLALWAFDLAEETVEALQEKYPCELRPREALQAARAWAAGDIKMRTAQRKILDCHALAKELKRKEDIAACHAVGQACSVVHTAGHAMGYPIYDLTSIVYKLGVENAFAAVEARKQTYIRKLLYWSEHTHNAGVTWAKFMLQ